MIDSILDTVKNSILSYDPESKDFDDELIMHINSSFIELNQIGVGPSDGFSIEDSTTTWDDLLTEGLTDAQNKIVNNCVKEYIVLNCKLAFELPESTNVTNSMKAIIEKNLNRIMMQIEYKKDGGV